VGCLKTRFLALFFCSVFEPAEIGPKAYSVGLFNDQKEGQKWSKPKTVALGLSHWFYCKKGGRFQHPF